MAQKTARGNRKPAAQSRPASPKPLDVLHPERALQIRDRVIELREYGYIEGLKVQATSQPLIDGLHALVAGAEAPPSAVAVRKLLAMNATAVQWLMAQAMTPTNEDIGAFAAAVKDNAVWVDTLDDIEGDALMTLWWEVNRGFFMRRFRELAMQAREQAAAAARSTTEGSTQP